jgi:succinate dehydrogenase/fumarate reductase flavoprotein subunit
MAVVRKSRALTRRGVLKGAAAVTLGAGTVAAVSGDRTDAEKWDREVDIVAVGSGIGATTAAVTAHHNGDSALVLEKLPLFGGTSAKTVGVIWVPNNFALRARGIEDRKEDALRYMARYSWPERYSAEAPRLGLSEHAYALIEAFYDNAARATDSIREWGVLNLAEWRMFALDHSATDYLDNVPENKVPAGRALGTVGADGKLGTGRDMMEQMGAALRRLEIPVLLGHRATRLVQDGGGRVTGIEADANGTRVRIRARKGVIFGSGGYAHNLAALERYQRTALYGSCAMPGATGDFIGIAGSIGAQLGQLSSAWRCQVVLEEALASRTLAAGVFFPPGDSVLQVNRYGLRAVNETRNYNDRGEVHGQFDPTRAEFPNHLMFMIWDQRTAEAYAGTYPIPEKPEGSPHVLRADSLEALAGAIDARLATLVSRTGGARLDGSFAANLRRSVERFNGFARSGKDADFGRGAAAYDNEWHRAFSPMRKDTTWPANDMPSVTMYPLREEGPYYAVILGAGALDTNGGPVIDAQARVLDTQDRPIPGLFGTGNCIASPSREAYWGAGHPLGLSLTFGYIAANAAHAAGTG